MIAKRRVMVGLSFVGALLVAQTSALAEPVQVQLIGTPTGFSMGGEMTSPYLLEINGVTTLALVCDDFNSTIYMEEQWYANKNSLKDVKPDGPQKFTDTDATLLNQEYTAVGLLAQVILSHYQAGAIHSYRGWGRYEFGEYSYALWSIFAPGASAKADNPGEAERLKGQYLVAAKTATLNMDIYTPCGTFSDGCAANNKMAAQEFLGVAVPEAGSLAFLAFNLLALPGILSVARRRRYWN